MELKFVLRRRSSPASSGSNVETVRYVLARSNHPGTSAQSIDSAPAAPAGIREEPPPGSDPGFPIVGVGGIVSADHAQATLRAGANLIQIYTGFAYRGPVLLEEIVNALPP